MSISGTLSNAYSGLVAAARSAEVISQNVSNAMTDGFGRREIALAASSLNGRGAGVRVEGVTRQVDQIAIADRRLAEAALGKNSVLADAHARMEEVIGVPGESGALADRVAAFESALVSAASRPESELRLQNVFYAAGDLVTHLNSISDTSQDMRMDADKSIEDQVSALNQTLADVAQLNRDIRVQIGAGRDVNGLKDQRQVLIDRIADVVPIKTFAREHGQIALTTTGGAVLLEGKPAVFDFAATGVITPDMTLASGALSGLTLNGKTVSIGSGNGLLAGGSLAALFEIRDKAAPFASAQVDALARNLMERFEEAGLDPTLSSGDPGLFTDSGSALDVSLETGLARRLARNTAVDPAEGGALWRLRDGLGATAAGSVGDNSRLSGFADALTSATTPASGQFSAGESSLSGLTGDLTALNSAARLEFERAESFSRGRFQELKSIEMESGVDTDREMQILLQVEQAYAANARVISTVDDMLQRLLEI